MAGFGVSFVPGGQGDQGEQRNPNGQQGPGGASPTQRAVQMLSLRLPRVVGANGLAPGPLLNAPGGGGMPGAGLGGAADNPLLQALLRLAGMMGGQPGGMPGQQPGVPPAMGPSGPPLPRVTPGDGAPPQPGPGVPTYPPMPMPQGPMVDRSDPGLGNRADGATSPFDRSPFERQRGPFTRGF